MGRDGVRHFYSNHLVGKFFPPGTEIVNVSRTIGEDQLVDTHAVPVEWMLPGVPPTGRRVEAAAVVIIKFEGGRIAHEHVYWDQASVLVQLGLLDTAGLPVSGAEGVHKMLGPKLPSRRLTG